MKKIIAVLAFGFLFQLALAQQKLPDDITASIQKRIESGHTPSIVVGIIDKDGPRYYAFGTKTIGGQPVNEHTIYEIGSISKTFTGLLLAQMALEGQLKTDDVAQKYLPAAVKMPTRGGKQITLGQLSDHTSALPRLPSNLAPKNPANPYADYTQEQLYDFLNSATLTRDIGSGFEYSNLAVGLLGHILSLKAGTSYENLVVNKIALPLGMKETRITFDEQMKQILAMGHSNGVQVSNWDIPTLAGAGGIRSSLHDMLRYLAANMGLQQSKLLAAMELSHQARHTDKVGDGTGVGLAWFITKGAEGDIISHNGGTGGYRTFAGFVKGTGKGVVVLTNSDKGADDIGMRLLDSTARLIQVKKSAMAAIKESLDKKGVDAALKTYEELKKDKAYELDENAVNTLGYSYLTTDKMAQALVLFKINVMEFPNSFNVYDSYGEALMKDGQKEAAIVNYKKSLELNPANTNGQDMLVKMGAAEPTKEVTVDESVLRTYVGVYELVPGFTITITQTGKQLFAQATGQEKFELFAKSDTEFYLKVVPAQVTFSAKDGKVDSLTLYQGGREMPGKRIK